MWSHGLVPASPETDRLLRRGVRLEWATNGWNVMEVVVTVTLGIQARSLALVAFGLDSVVEIFASSVVIWNLHDTRSDPGDRRIHRSLRLIAVAFWVLAAFLCAASVRGLVLENRPEGSPLAIAYLALTACIMFGLSVLKRRIAQRIPSETLLAESAMTFLDGCLASSVLVALILNDALDWWWSDALAALVVAGFAVAEGVRHWRDSAPHEDLRGST
jgi:divalent metal cation (Fe/Co/Zn/Cd) transporter